VVTIGATGTCLTRRVAEADEGDFGSGLVPDREFVVPGGHGAVLLEQVDAALDGVPLGVAVT
jgi:hypothetical protein